MAFDATDLEIARREHSYEMGAETASDRRWSQWYDRASSAIRALGFGDDLDGNEYTGAGEPSDGYSIDGASDAFDRGETVDTYMKGVVERRRALGLAA